MRHSIWQFEATVWPPFDHGLFEKFNTFCGAKVVVAFQFRKNVLVVLDEPFNVGKVYAPVAVDISDFGYDDLMWRLRLWREKVNASASRLIAAVNLSIVSSIISRRS